MPTSRYKSTAEKAISYLKNGPRINVMNIKDNPGARTKGRQVRSKDNKAGGSHKELERAAKPPLGWIWGDWFMPWQRRFPSEQFYNKDIHLRREYPPLSLLELQRLIDLGWINIDQPVDLTTLCNTGQYRCNPVSLQFGAHLTEEVIHVFFWYFRNAKSCAECLSGGDVFASRVNIEVQWASELAIAAIERNGGCITVGYYDPVSLLAAVDPIGFFQKAQPIPKRSFPPMDIMDYYTDPCSRGYLANPAKVEKARLELAQKYGYQYWKCHDPLFNMRKDPLQIFFGLEPGWIINLKDKNIIKPIDPLWREYYSANWCTDNITRPT